MILDLNYKFISVDTNDYFTLYQLIKKEAQITHFNLYSYSYMNNGFFKSSNELTINNVDVNTALEGVIKKIKKSILTNSVIFINNLNRYLQDINLIKFYCNIEQLYSMDIKNNKFVFNVTLNKLPKEIAEIFIPISIKNEIDSIKKEFVNTSKIDDINYKKNSLIKLINLAAIKQNNDMDIYHYYLNKDYSIIKKINDNEIDFNNIGNFKELKEYFEDIRTAINKGYIKYPKRILITGKSGTGKTMFAKASANFLKIGLYRVDLSILFDKYLGNTEKNMDILWEELYNLPLSIVLFDEIEKMLSGGSSSDNSDAGTTARAMSKFLYNLQEYSGNAIIIGTVNNINILSDEYFRDKRWDKIYCSIKNDIDTLKAILNNHKVKFNNTDLKKLYSVLENKTGAYMDNLITNIIFHLEALNLPITIKNILKEV